MKVVFKKVPACDECPYFHMQDTPYEDIGNEQWYACGLTDKILVTYDRLKEWQEENEVKYPFTIPAWCPLQDYDLFHAAITAVK